MAMETSVLKPAAVSVSLAGKAQTVPNLNVPKTVSKTRASA